MTYPHISCGADYARLEAPKKLSRAADFVIRDVGKTLFKAVHNGAGSFVCLKAGSGNY